MRSFYIILTVIFLGIIAIYWNSEMRERTIPEKYLKNSSEETMDQIAEAYVKLVLKAGTFDPDFVDAYYGPDEWKPDTSKDKVSLPTLADEGRKLAAQLEKIRNSKWNEMERSRHEYLTKQLTAVNAKIEMLSGEKFTFDEESKLLYDAVAPTHDKSYFENLLSELDKSLPGKGSVSGRLEDFKKLFIIPKPKLDAVFNAAINECRKRTLMHMALPENENFKVEYVTGKAWSAYNWYKGGGFSVIQVNTDLPIYLDRAIDLACHEGYPGHHVYNALLEKNLVRDKKWPEFSVYALFSPQSLIAEGSANYGIEVTFPADERIAFERDILFPLAGLDSRQTEKYYAIMALAAKCSYAGNEAARNYLDGKMTKEEAIRWLRQYGLFAKDRAEQRIRFIEKYRSYVINYNLGQDLVKNYIEKKGGTPDHSEKRWELFMQLLSNPFTPSGLLR